MATTTKTKKGTIRVQTENIFPIIKKFLYNDHDIFLRELVSNAMDATQKIKTLAANGEPTGDLGDLRINVILDVAQKTLTIQDMGLGMTMEEVDKYINQVAFSSAEDFLQKYKDVNIIGHFGLGFYSAFMVSKKVEIFTKSYKNEPATYWACDGSPEYELKVDATKKDRGTTIVLHINEESQEFLDQWRIQDILKKFCKFLPTPIYFENIEEKKDDAKTDDAKTDDAKTDDEKTDDAKTDDEKTDDEKKEAENKKEETKSVPKPINNTQPLWIKKPNEVTKEDYESFYKELYPFNETPLFWIHLNVDYPFNLTGILYFPKIKEKVEIQKDRIQLYCNQVYVTDEVKDILPDFMMMLQGVIDSPDIPLNVSRSYLQGDANVKKINTHITKKVADKLDELFRTDRKSYQEKWDSLSIFIKYGMITDAKFQEKANAFYLFKDVDGNFCTFEEYKMETETLQKKKDDQLIILYTNDPIKQDSYIQSCKSKNYKVILFNELFDSSFMNAMESKWDKVRFKRVDADTIDNLIDVAENKEMVLSKDETEQLKKLFEVKVNGIRLNVDIKGLSPDATPITATRPEFSRRMKEMAKSGSQFSSFYANADDEVNVVINGNHALCQTVLKTTDATAQQSIVRNLIDLALLSQGLLQGPDLTNYINRSIGQIQK
ncbi:MAG: molecular chaperone HtpG [Phycisphaerales bacterium]|nr:molecular chaperone HtpG [Phycisphaerales bacterium]